ncbi:MAG: UPF0280 family protein [Archaeoglobales archaeon]|nr:UPF0280 family protein [Archaeoglobales archaeon]
MRRFKFAYKETIVTIITESEEFFEACVKAILEARSEIERYIALNPDFYISYEPLDCKGGRIIDEMCKAAKIAGVGPMASVAGAIADFAVEKMAEAGAKLAIVDNGGDIAMKTDREISVGIYPTELAFIIEPKNKYSICTSSGTIGPSVSFGYADAATVLGENAAVCDALATALGNGVKKDFELKDLEEYVREFYNKYKDFIDGVFVAKGDEIAFTGNLPEIVPAKVSLDLITKA